tara:strand:+ start:767 stop:967 length:201 start_codon:yes stop_codon:yes gene_type:complete
MKLELKTLLPYLVLLVTIGMTWGMFSERLDAVEAKADSVIEMQRDIAVIKEKIMWMEAYMIKGSKN